MPVSSGCVIGDDYGAVKRCRAAIEDYRAEQSRGVPIEWSGVYSQRSR